MINLRLLANIINDAHIGGNKSLQGAIFAKVIDYMRSYVSHLIQHHNHSYEQVKLLLNELSSVSNIETFINSKPDEQELHDKARALTQYFLQASQEKVLTLPGGWRNYYGDDNHHAMLYQFKMDNGFVILSVFNSGAGLEYHDRADTPEKQRYLAIRSFQIGHYTQIEQSHFQGFLKTLLYSRLPHLRQDDLNPKIDAKTLYEQILPQVYALNKYSQVRVIEQPQVTTSGQLAGTCPQRALQQYIKQAFDTLEDYQRFIFHYKLYAFEDYINYGLAEENLPRVMVEEQLNNARNELLRILNLKELFSNSAKQALWQRIDDSYQKRLDYNQLAEHTSVSEKDSDYHQQLSLPEGAFQNLLINSSTPSKQLPQFLTINPSNDLLNEFKRFKSYILELLNKHKQNELAYRHIEHLFLSLPLDADHVWYQSITDQDQLNDFLQMVRRIQEVKKEASCSGRKPLRPGEGCFPPRALLTHMHLLAVIDTLEHKINKYSARTQAYQFWIKQFLARNAYLNTGDQALDQCYEQLKKHYGRIISFQDDFQDDWQDTMFNEYFKALDKHPESTKRLADKFCELSKERQNKLNNYIIRKSPEEQKLHQALYTWSLDRYKLKENFELEPLCREIKQVECLDQVLTTETFFSLEFQEKSKWTCPSKKITYKKVIMRSQGLQYGNLKNLNGYYIEAFIGDQDKNLSKIQIRDNLSFEKVFYHLRCSPSNQIPLTLAYYSSNLDLLADGRHQQNLEANFFEPGLLKQTLDQDNDFLSRFDDFITKGLKVYCHNGVNASPNSLFFIHINYLVSQYAADINPSKYNKRLETLVQTIQHLIDNVTDDKVKSALHRYQFLSLFKLQKLSPSDPDIDSLKQLLKTHHYHQVTADEKQTRDWANYFNWQLIQNEFEQFLLENKDNIEKHKQALIRDLLTGIYPDQFPEQLFETANLRIKNNFPHFDLPSLKVTLDITKGALFNSQGMAYMPLPEKIRDSPDIIAFGKPNYGYKVYDGSRKTDIYRIRSPQDHSVIYATYQDSELVLQRQFRVEGRVDWYQSQSHSVLNQLLSDYPDYGLAAACMGDNIKLWYAQNQQDALITHNQRPIYCIDSRESIIRPIESGKLSAFQLKPLPDELRELLANVEQQQFTLYLENASHAFKVALPRYGMRLTGKHNNGSLTLSLEDMPDYQVELNTKPLGLDVLGLTLIHATSSHRFLWLPVQPFECDSAKRDDGFYHLNQMRGAELSDPPVLDLANSEYAIEISLDHSGQPVLANTPQALYVAYLYLGQYEVDKAWQVLNYCHEMLCGLHGTPNEILYLNWIATLSSPNTHPFVACKLRVLSLLTDYLEQGYQLPQLADSESNPQPLESVTETIMALYQRYQSLKEHGHYAYQLTPKQRLSLLNYIKKNTEYFEGPPAVEHSKLYLALFKQEYDHLKWLNKQKVLSSKLYPRLQFLDDFLSQDKPIHTSQLYQLYSELESSIQQLQEKDALPHLNQRIDSQKSDSESHSYDSNNDPQDPDNPSRTDYGRIQKQVEDRIEGLLSNKPTLSSQDYINANSALFQAREYTFFYHFPVYYALTLGIKEDEALKKNLKWYCKSRIISHSNTQREDQDLVTYLCYILYKLLNADRFRCRRIYDETRTQIERHQRRRWDSDVNNRLKIVLNKVCEVLSSPEPTIGIFEAKHKIEQLTHTQAIIGSLANEPMNVELMMAEVPKDEGDITRYAVGKTLQSFKDTDQLLHLLNQFYIDVQQQLKSLNDNIDKQRQNLNTEEAEFKTAELEAGQSMLSHYSQLKEQATQIITSNSCQALKSLAEQQKENCQEQLGQFWDDIVQLANKPPQDESKKIEHQVAIAAKAKAPIDEALLFKLYFSADKAAYRQATHLSDDDIQSLHNQLAVYVQLKTYEQHWQRIQEAVTSFYNRSEQDQDQACYELAQVLSASNQVDPYTEPKLALFQMQENVLLYPQQKATLNRLLQTMQPNPKKTGLSRFLQNLLPKNKSNSNPLLHNSELTSVANNGYQETVEKIIMGGGKSKVLLPSLAQKKATGLNLVVVEVPKALLNTNFVDLHRTSYKLFGQEAVKFEFDRNSDCSPKQLEALYNKIYQVMINRDYLVTTGEAIQSLELKYIELLTSGAPTNKKLQWEKQVRFLNDLVSLFRNRADGVIDEIHQGLLLKRKLNYTTGQSSQLPQTIIESTLALYRFMANIQPEGELSLGELLRNNQGLDSDNWLKYQAILAKKLVENEDSPLQPIIEQCLANQGDNDETAQKHLINYLQDQTDNIPDVVYELSSADKDTIALYKQQISVILPQTLNRRLGEHYGPSKDATKSIIKRMEAIPYSANEVPCENSRFGHPVELLNYTIQSFIIRGFNTKHLGEWISQLQQQAKQESWFYQGRPFNQTEAAGLFSKLTGGLLNLMLIDVHSSTDIRGALQLLTDNQAVTEHILKSLVLPAIELEAGYYHSDAMNHVDMYRSVQGFSGTPWNASTFHSRLSYDPQKALGNDGYVISVIQSKQPAIEVADMNDLHDYTRRLVNNPQTRAVIDIGAIFRGHSNDEVGRALVQALHQHEQDHQMEYVLYFNEADVLCGLSLHDPSNPIEIGSSDEANIREKLGCSPDKRLTYYDQAHTIGADIKQQTDAHACILIDNQTKIDDFLQGTMRMRGLHDKQTIDIVVPTSLQEQSLQTLIDKMHANQSQALIQDNYYATLAEMANTIQMTYSIKY